MTDQTIAILADIHGNVWALDAVLADLDRRGISKIFDLGDSLYGPMDPAGTADRLLGRDIPSIRGNCDRFLIEPGDTPPATVAYALAQLAPQPRYLAWLAAQPLTRTLDEGNLLLCHGTPGSDETYLLEQPSAEGGALLPDEEIARRVGDVSAQVICCAHSHMPRLVALRDGRLIVNPGSVGMPAYTEDTPVPHVMQAGSPHARYAILTRNDGETTGASSRSRCPTTGTRRQPARGATAATTGQRALRPGVQSLLSREQGANTSVSSIARHHLLAAAQASSHEKGTRKHVVPIPTRSPALAPVPRRRRHVSLFGTGDCRVQL